MRLLTGALLLACLAAACGSGDEAIRDTATATSERAERPATITQQQQTQPRQTTVQDTTAQEVDQPAEPQTEPQADLLPADDVGVHKGLRSERHVLGEPDAPVEIRYFGDFT